MKTAVFTPDVTESFHDTNGVQVSLVGGQVEILRQLGPDEVDVIDVGDMYEVRNSANGRVTHAFADELTAWGEK